LHVIDNICGDLDFEEGGNPVSTNRIILGFDAVLLDNYCAALIGYNPNEIGYLSLIKKYITDTSGVGGGADVRVIEMNADKKPHMNHTQSAGVKKYAAVIDEDGACSACYAALVYALRQTGVGAVRTSASKHSERTDKIKIGQGFKGKKCAGIGSGNCASGCGAYVKGCPPSALDIVEFLYG
jgi:hypothetical protein